MKVTVTKQPDGNQYLTNDGFGELFAENVEPEADPVKFGDNTLQVTQDPHVFAEPGDLVVVFSWVDYLDTENRETPGKGVRHTEERRLPGRWDFGPYTVEVKKAK